MALVLKAPGANPIGWYDAVDSVTTSVKGGEVGTLTSVTYASGDLTAAGPASVSGADGYVNPGTSRMALTTNLPASIAGTLGLIDEGLAYYGTLFGTVVGATAGQKSVGGTVIGPHTATGSGKFTFWTKPGTYSVTLDAVDTTASTGLVPTNATLTIGAALYAKTGTGLLSPQATSVIQSGGSNMVVGRFVMFETNGSLVTTPVSLVGGTPSYVQAQFEFNANL